MHLSPLIRDLAVILGAAGLISLLFQRIRQPVVLGYIVAGIVIGPHTPPYSLISDIPSITTWAELGVIFLMFSLGLEFSFRKLAKVGFSAGITACFEVLFMLILGFATGSALGWSGMDSLFLGAMLSISSTTIIIKALDELKLRNRSFAEMIFAVLIVEDLVAILILVSLSAIAVNKAFSGIALLTAAWRLFLVVGSWFIAGYLVVPRFVRYVGRVGTLEMLVNISVGLCLALVVFAAYFEYSVALGAFIMGSLLAESRESHRVQEKIESLRDLFAAIFFVSVGMLIDPKTLWSNLPVILLITGVTILGKVFSTTVAGLLTGQPLKKSVQVGFGLAQIGEFSFIIASLGRSLNITSDFIYPVGVAVSLITTFATPYMLRGSQNFALALEKRLPVGLASVLNQYLAWAQGKLADSAQKKELTKIVLKWLINGLIVSVFFILSAQSFLPFLKGRIGDVPETAILCWLITATLSAPFVWGMLSTFKKSPHQDRNSFLVSLHNGVYVLIFRFLTLIWLGALSVAFFPAKYVVPVIGILELTLFGRYYRKIEASYRWFEERFLSTFENDEKVVSASEALRHLAPWDVHLSTIKIHPNAAMAGKSISDSQLRSRFGVNIIAIQRGLSTIVSPQPNEVLLPDDQLLALGTDEQLEPIRSFIENPRSIANGSEHISNYELRHTRVSPSSVLIGKTIRATKIRESFGATIVGIERGDQRIINPDPDFSLHADDILWIVGEKSQLDLLKKEQMR